MNITKGLTYDDVLLVPRYCDLESRRSVDISVKIGKYHFDLPVISAPMDTITGSAMAAKMAQLGGLGLIHRFMSVEDNVKEFNLAVKLSAQPLETASGHIGVSVGANEGMDRTRALYAAGARIFCVDVAHGHSKMSGLMVKAIKAEFPDSFVIAGAVATHEGVVYLNGCGADLIRVGIGPGSACLTRIKTGFGVPQLTAVMECARSVKPIIADGGIKSPGDVVKALAAGAKMVMIGGMFSGTEETPGKVISDVIIQQRNGDTVAVNKRKAYRGMASREAFEDYFGAMPDWKTAEGVSVEVPYKGSVEKVVQDIIGGLRSGLTYCGVGTIEELQSQCEFIEITAAGMAESHAHIKTV